MTKIISLVGAGGKTTLMFRLARELDGPCIATTTTKVGLTQILAADQRCAFADLSSSPDKYANIKSLWVSPSLEDNEVKGKLVGFDLAGFSELARIAAENSFSIITEADGAATRHIKAPGEHEPVIPPETDTVICLCGLDTLGKPINAENVFRTEIFQKITGTKENDIIDEAVITRLMLHPEGGFKNAPTGSRRVVVFTHVESDERLRRGELIAETLRANDIEVRFIKKQSEE